MRNGFAQKPKMNGVAHSQNGLAPIQSVVFLPKETQQNPTTARTAARRWTEESMRLIDADELKADFCAHCATLKRYKRTVDECQNYTDTDGNRCFKMRYIDSSPTIEAEPVIRCEQCKHCEMVVDIIGDLRLFCGLSPFKAEKQFGDFCSDGERKEPTP